MDKISDKLSNIGIDAVLALLQALLILIIGLKVSKWIVKIFKKTKLYKKLDPSVATFLTSALRIVLDTVVFISFAGLIGFPLTSIITILGSVGLAIGMGLQGGLANIAGGIIILYCKPFSVGDFIDTHTDCGTVKSISLFYTTITTLDNKTVTIPNGNLANSPTVNFSKEPKRRLDIKVSVSYNDKIDDVKKVLQSVVDNEHETIINDEPVFIGITDYLDSAINYEVRVWVKPTEFWNTKVRMLENIKREFDKHKITIPFPQMDVHMIKD
jgi:small conductance mechanosensitive channel